MSAIRRHMLLPAALLLAAPLALALSDEKDAVKALKQDGKDLLATYKAELKVVRTDLDPKLKQIQADLLEAYQADTVDDLFLVLVDLQTGLSDAAIEALSALQLSAYFTLVDLAGAGDLEGLYPPDFYLRSGSYSDQVMAAVQSGMFKELARAEKKLTGMMKKAGKKGSNLSIFLERYPELYEGVWNADGAFAPGGYFSTLDVIVAGSDGAVAHDGTIVVGGYVNDNLDVHVKIGGPAGEGEEQVVAPFVGRWSASFTGLEEGNWLVQARPEGDAGQWKWKVVSVR